MKNIKKNYIYISAIFLTSIILRLYNLNFEDLWFDEIASLWVADPNISINETVERNIEVNQGPHLIFTIILKYFFLIFGYNPDIARLVPVLFGILSVPTIIYLTKTIDKTKAWLLIGFLISINYYSISYSQELRSYSFIFFLSLLNIIFFIKILKNNNLLNNLLFYLISLLAVCNHVFIFIILFSELLFIILFYRNNKKIFYTLGVNIFIIFCSYLFLMHDSISAQFAIKEFWIVQIKIDFFIDYYFSRFFGSKIMGLVYLMTLFYLIWSNRKILINHSSKLFLFLLIMMNSYFIPITYGFINMPILTDRYIIFVLIPILILISILIFHLNSKKTRNTILTILILTTLVNNYIEIFERKNTKPEFKKSFLFIKDSNSLNYTLADNVIFNNKIISNYLKLVNSKNTKLRYLKNVNNPSLKKVWVICYLPVTNFSCNKPLLLNNNFVKRERKSFHLIKLILYENLNHT